MRVAAWAGVLLASAAAAQQSDRPSEDQMFGGPAQQAASTTPDGGATPAVTDEKPAADRPSEDSMFGGSGTESLSDTLRGKAEGDSPKPPAGDRDFSELSGPSLKSRFDTDEEKNDPLKLGGTLYWRGMATFTENTPFENQAFSAPALLDAFLDARPNDRVRGMAVARLRYDPTLQPSSSTTIANQALMPQTVAVPTSNPAIFLDQLWLRFDIAHTVFVTAGRQKVRWGVSRLWTPTDFLNSQRRDPLQPFDLRLGANMVKFHLPIEKWGWNFYGYGLLDNVTPANQLGNIGGALRAEFVIPGLGTEIGMGGVWVKGARPRYAVDISSPLGPLDVYAEVAFRDGKDFNLWRVNGSPNLEQPLDSVFEQYRPNGTQVLASGGLSYTFNYTDKNAVTVGAEYFYNPIGANTPALYPWLILQNGFNPFYAGQHYAGAFVLFPGLPDAQWMTVNVTSLMNISDLSGTSRVDFFFRVLTYLQVEAFAAVNYGTRGGEFRFALDLPPLPLGDGTFTPPVVVNAPVASCGVGLRINI